MQHMNNSLEMICWGEEINLLMIEVVIDVVYKPIDTIHSVII